MSLSLLQLRFADTTSKEEHLGFIYHPFRTSLGRITREQPTQSIEELVDVPNSRLLGLAEGKTKA